MILPKQEFIELWENATPEIKDLCSLLLKMQTAGKDTKEGLTEMGFGKGCLDLFDRAIIETEGRC